MKIFIVEVPTLDRTGLVPFGVLYAASSVLRKGHEVKLPALFDRRNYGRKQNMPINNIEYLVNLKFGYFFLCIYYIWSLTIRFGKYREKVALKM